MNKRFLLNVTKKTHRESERRIPLSFSCSFEGSLLDKTLQLKALTLNEERIFQTSPEYFFELDTWFREAVVEDGKMYPSLTAYLAFGFGNQPTLLASAAEGSTWLNNTNKS